MLETGIQPISYTDRTAIQRMQLQCVSVLSVDATLSYSFITPEQSYSIVLQASTVNTVAHIVHTKIVASPRCSVHSTIQRRCFRDALDARWARQGHTDRIQKPMRSPHYGRPENIAETHYATRPCENQQGNESVIVRLASKAMTADNDGKTPGLLKYGLM